MAVFMGDRTSLISVIRSFKTPLRFVLIVPFVLQIMAAVGWVGYLSYRSGQKAVDTMTKQVMDQVTHRIQEHLDLFTQTAQQTITLNHRAAQEGRLNIEDLAALRQHFWQQINLSPSLAAISFANEQRELVGYQRIISPDLLTYARKVTGKNLSLGTFFFEEIRLPEMTKRKFYLLDKQGRSQELVYAPPIYDIRTAPWYLMAKKVKQQAWSSIYIYKSSRILGISAIAPVYDQQGNLQGVLNSNNPLDGIGFFLSTLKFSPSGKAFILDRSGDLVATSTHEMTYIIDSRGDLIRLNVNQSRDPWTRAIAAHLQQKHGKFQRIPDDQFKVAVKDNHLLVQVMPYRDRYGLDWLLVVVIPESDFMEQIHTNVRITFVLCLLTLLISIGLGIITSNWIALPIAKLSQASRAIAKGDLNHDIRIKGIAELESLSDSFREMKHQLKISFETLEYQVQKRTEELTIANERLQTLATIDGLTQIANRRCFDDYLSVEWQRHQRGKQPLGLILIDIDYFKKYNDIYGHQQGDECLVKVAQTIGKNIRRPADLAARYGGEEFAVILPNTDLKGTLTVAESIRKAVLDLAIPHQTSGVCDRVTLSLGIASQIPTAETSIKDLIFHTDQALYTAKKQGRNQVQFLDSVEPV